MTRTKRLFWTIFAAGTAFVPGCLLSVGVANVFGVRGEVGRILLPHHVPKSRDGLSFRFAMAHDVIHERYPKHGPAFYLKRERRARERLAQIPPNSDEAFALYDDIGVGLERLGKPSEAIPILRKKLELQQNRGLNGSDLYTTFANLGTFIAHANMPKAIAGDAQAKKSAEEGIDFVRKSIEVNPDAHFGREIWQVVLANFLLSAISDPSLVDKYDFIGNSLEETWASLRSAVVIDDSELRFEDDFGRPFQRVFRGNWLFRYDQFRHGEDQFRPIDLHDNLQEIREVITRVGHPRIWTKESMPELYVFGMNDEHIFGVPFDEPMLGIIGMWRQGGGANPHFALCIGEVMLRVGQRRIAWTAYERAKQLAPKFWPKPEVQKRLRDHCDKRQKEIEDTLLPEEIATLRPSFNDELAFGQKYQTHLRHLLTLEARKVLYL